MCNVSANIVHACLHVRMFLSAHMFLVEVIPNHLKSCSKLLNCRELTVQLVLGFQHGTTHMSIKRIKTRQVWEPFIIRNEVIAVDL